VKKPRKGLAKSSGGMATGSREFARRARLAERKAARRQTARKRAAARSQATLSLVAASRKALARIPVAARVCALLAFLNAVCWAQITPPLQGPDEVDHFAYVQGLVEDDRLPSPTATEYSQEVTLAVQDVQ
jgi:hypothetical protein